MKFIFGGAYQGKLDFVKEKFNILDSDICDLKDNNLDLSKKVFNHIECLIRTGYSFKLNIDLFKDKILISNDESQGLVPINEIDRLYRENLGRELTYISKSSEEVYRVFCGIGVKIK